MPVSLQTCPCVCPLCARPNRCAMASPPSADVQAPCWCVRVQFSATLLAQVPEAARGQACLCQACVAKAKKATA